MCHLNSARNVTLFERGFFSLLHCGEDTRVCVTKRESSEAVERDDTEKLIHIDHHKYPPPPSHTHQSDFSTIFSNFQTVLASFFHRIYILTNLATFWINLSYGSVGRYCPASVRSDFLQTNVISIFYHTTPTLVTSEQTCQLASRDTLEKRICFK